MSIYKRDCIPTDEVVSVSNLILRTRVADHGTLAELYTFWQYKYLLQMILYLLANTAE